MSPPSAPHSDDERDTVVVQHGAKDNNNNFGDVLEPRRASSPALNPGTPTGFSAGSFARADSNSDVDVADEFEDLDAGVISRFPPRHSPPPTQMRNNDCATTWQSPPASTSGSGSPRNRSPRAPPERHPTSSPCSPSSNAAPAQSPTSPSKTLGPAQARAGRISRIARSGYFYAGSFELRRRRRLALAGQVLGPRQVLPPVGHRARGRVRRSRVRGVRRVGRIRREVGRGRRRGCGVGVPRVLLRCQPHHSTPAP